MKVRSAAVAGLAAALIILTACQQATPPQQPTQPAQPAPRTISEAAFNQLWEGYLPLLRGARLSLNVAWGAGLHLPLHHNHHRLPEGVNR